MTTASTTDELNFLGARVRILASGGAVGAVEMLEAPAGDMPPLHVHHSSDESFYLLGGELTLFMPGVERTLHAGDFLVLPRGIPHTYRVGDAPAHWLVVSAPSGFERFVARVAELGKPSPEELTAVAAEHDIEILGPPGTLP
jgi:quercetin dioxygenase-like cupin family protein